MRERTGEARISLSPIYSKCFTLWLPRKSNLWFKCTDPLNWSVLFIIAMRTAGRKIRWSQKLNLLRWYKRGQRKECFRWCRCTESLMLCIVLSDLFRKQWGALRGLSVLQTVQEAGSSQIFQDKTAEREKGNKSWNWAQTQCSRARKMALLYLNRPFIPVNKTRDTWPSPFEAFRPFPAENMAFC